MAETPRVRLYLLRHGEVLSHRGDVPITSAAAEHASEVGASFADPSRAVTVLCGETRRAIETAENLCRGVEDAGGRAQGPTIAHALRNPDLYLAGVRVDMVSSHEALAAQVPGLETRDVADLDFFPQFISETDRIGWWLRHEDPPGEDARAIAARISRFARSLVNPYRPEREVVVAVTHSPLIRAAGLGELGYDIGEPDWVSGLSISVGADRSVVTERFPDTAR